MRLSFLVAASRTRTPSSSSPGAKASVPSAGGMHRSYSDLIRSKSISARPGMQGRSRLDIRAYVEGAAVASLSPVGWNRSVRSNSSGVGPLTPVVAGLSTSSFPLVPVSFDPLEEYGGTSPT